VRNLYAIYCQKNTIFRKKAKYFFGLSKKELLAFSYWADRLLIGIFNDFALLTYHNNFIFSHCQKY
jgi:hypothetical protein